MPILLLAALYGASPETGPDPLAGLPNVERRHYDVTGLSVPAIRKAINAARPADPSGASPGLDALSRWRIDYGWETEEKDGCRVTSTQAKFQAEILLPRLVPPTDPKAEIPARVRAKWDEYIAALEAHEARYLRQAFEGVPAVEKALRSSGCDSAGQAGAEAVAALVRRETDQRALKQGRLKVKF